MDPRRFATPDTKEPCQGDMVLRNEVTAGPRSNLTVDLLLVKNYVSSCKRLRLWNCVLHLRRWLTAVFRVLFPVLPILKDAGITNKP